MDTEFCLVITTTGSHDHASAIAEHVLQKNLAACVQIMPVESRYLWQGNIRQDSEFALHIKTRTALFEPLEAAIRAIHTYQTPEIIRLPITGGHGPYLDWIRAVTAL